MPTPTHARRLESPYICEYRLGGDEAVGIVEVVPDGAVPLAEVPTIGNHFSFVGAAVMLTAALQEAHAKKLLHPGLVTDVMWRAVDGTLVLGGFLSGLTRSVPPSAIATTAPELLNSDARPSPAANVWSLGCMFYYFLTGRLPFGPGLNAPATAAAVRSGSYAPLPTSLPTGVVALVTGMLTSSRSQRPTLAEVRAVLEELRESYLSSSESSIPIPIDDPDLLAYDSAYLTESNSLISSLSDPRLNFSGELGQDSTDSGGGDAGGGGRGDRTALSLWDRARTAVYDHQVLYACWLVSETGDGGKRSLWEVMRMIRSVARMVWGLPGLVVISAEIGFVPMLAVLGFLFYPPPSPFLCRPLSSSHPPSLFAACLKQPGATAAEEKVGQHERTQQHPRRVPQEEGEEAEVEAQVQAKVQVQVQVQGQGQGKGKGQGQGKGG